MQVVASNTALAIALDGTSPNADSSCSDYTGDVDKPVGHGWDVRTGVDPSQPAGLFTGAYNNSVRDFGCCPKNKARLRP